jgi:hypothetical protein
MAAVVVSLPQERPQISLEDILLNAISIDLRVLESLIDPEHDQKLECG